MTYGLSVLYRWQVGGQDTGYTFGLSYGLPSDKRGGASVEGSKSASHSGHLLLE